MILWVFFFFNWDDPFAVSVRLNTEWDEERTRRTGVPPASNWRGFVGFGLPPESRASRCPLLVLCLSLSLTLLPVQLSSLPSLYLFIFVPLSYMYVLSRCPSPSQMYPLLLLHLPLRRSPSTFQLRVPALPRSHSTRFTSPPTVHRFNHEYLFPSRSIRIRSSRFLRSLL